MRTPSRSTSSTERMGDPAGTRYVDGISRYADEKAISAARCGSAPRKATSHAPVFTPSPSLPAVSNLMNSTGTPTLRPSSRATSDATPIGGGGAGGDQQEVSVVEPDPELSGRGQLGADRLRHLGSHGARR